MDDQLIFILSLTLTALLSICATLLLYIYKKKEKELTNLIYKRYNQEVKQNVLEHIHYINELIDNREIKPIQPKPSFVSTNERIPKNPNPYRYKPSESTTPQSISLTHKANYHINYKS